MAERNATRDAIKRLHTEYLAENAQILVLLHPLTDSDYKHEILRHLARCKELVQSIAEVKTRGDATG